MARKSTEPVLLDLPDQNPAEAVYVIDGEIKTLELTPTPRSHQVDTLRDLISAANRFTASPDDAETTEPPSVWVDEHAVRLVIDDGEHRANTVAFPLFESDQFKTLCALATGKPKFQQKPFVRLLRVDLAGCLSDSILLNQVRRLKFENSSVVSGEVKHARESMGREITSKVNAVENGELPEEVIVHVPVYRNRGEVTLVQPVRCALEIDPALGEFQLTPLPGEIQRIKDAALADIEDRLGAGLTEGIHLYNGRP